MPPEDRTQQLVLALIVAVFIGYAGYTHPAIIPALTLSVAVFAAVALLLKL
ncbi:hypothetical protein AB0M32_36085 [Streptomyces sp. NPDC051985]|uniref:hypothetical protein n=1 Tax=Streptomyces sp. NPDC051985 TaxID=3155807 RepID=UPI00342027F9